MAVVAKTDRPPVTIPPKIPAQATDCNAVKAYKWDINTAYAICMAESRGVAHKDNAGLNRDGSVDYGLMQINSVHADMVNGDLESLRDPKVNIRIAYSLSRQGTDWTAWTTYNNGQYREFLK